MKSRTGSFKKEEKQRAKRSVTNTSEYVCFLLHNEASQKKIESVLDGKPGEQEKSRMARYLSHKL